MDLTRTLARYALSASAAMPDEVIHQAGRAFVNYMGCALGGADTPAVEHALAHADEFSGARHATVIGRSERLDAQSAAWINCLASSIHTFDDTHLASVTHPTGPVAAAAMAVLQHRPELAVDGRAFLAAIALGVEISCRVAATMTMAPAQPSLGLFTTGLAGGIGAAAACARLLGLDERRTAWALGIAAAQGCGFRATHATMSGGLVPALGARSGLAAASLAGHGFDCSESALEGRYGFFDVYAPGAELSTATDGLGDRFELLLLSFKPYPCGVVIHPAIDAALALFDGTAGKPIANVALTVHPMALQLTGIRHPVDAMATRNSLYHWTAAALARGRAGLAETTLEAVNDQAIAGLRVRIEATPDDALARDEVRMRLMLADGRVLEAHVPHALGGPLHPMADADLASKFMGMASARLPAAQAHQLLAACESLPDAGAAWLPRLAGLSSLA